MRLVRRTIRDRGKERYILCHPPRASKKLCPDVLKDCKLPFVAISDSPKKKFATKSFKSEVKTIDLSEKVDKPWTPALSQHANN